MAEDVRTVILKQLKDSCNDCGITNDVIDMQTLICCPESPEKLVYRARLHLHGTSQADSDRLISLLEEWVKTGSTVNVTGILLTVDTGCPVEVTSLSEDECRMDSQVTPGTVFLIIVLLIVVVLLLIISLAVMSIYFVKKRFGRQVHLKKMTE